MVVGLFVAGLLIAWWVLTVWLAAYVGARVTVAGLREEARRRDKSREPQGKAAEPIVEPASDEAVAQLRQALKIGRWKRGKAS